MCTMKDILFYILLACVLTVIFGKNEVKEDFLHIESKELIDEELLDEAKQDIVKLLYSRPQHSDEDESFSPPVNIYEPKSVVNTQLINQLDEILKRLGVSTKQTHVIKTLPPKYNLRNGYKWNDRTATTENPYDNLMKSVTALINDAFEKRIKATNERVNQLVKKLDEKQGNIKTNTRFNDHVEPRHGHYDGSNIKFSVHNTDESEIAQKILDRVMKLDHLKQRGNKLRQNNNENVRIPSKIYSNRGVMESDSSDVYQDLIKYLNVNHKARGKAVKREVNPNEVFDFVNNNELYQPIIYLRTEKKDVSTETQINKSKATKSDENNSLSQIMSYLKSNRKHNKDLVESKIKASDEIELTDNDGLLELVKYLYINRGQNTAIQSSVNETDLSDSVSGKALSEINIKHGLKENVKENDLNSNNKSDFESDEELNTLQRENKSKSRERILRTSDSVDFYFDQPMRHFNSHRDERGEAKDLAAVDDPLEHNNNYEIEKSKEGAADNSVRRFNQIFDKNNVTNEPEDIATSDSHSQIHVNVGIDPSIDRIHDRVEIPTSSFGVQEEHHGRRSKRSTYTQAGYTQDPDTCKTYNENLVKLWSNLSNYINVTEQPDERALHNIAIMIQAYLEHHKAKAQVDFSSDNEEESRDKIFDIIVKIKKMFDDEEATPSRITKVIIKYIKPFYGDVENDECQQVNEESLSSSVDLLFKNYQENAKCLNDGDSYSRNEDILRKRTKSLKSSNNWNQNTDNHADSLSIITEDQFHKDYHRGKTPRNRPSRRVFKRSKRLNSRKSPLISRSGELNETFDKPKARSKPKVQKNNKKSKKSSLKSDIVKGRCESHAVRKFTFSLRPVIERFMALLECQLDNTLRTQNYIRVSQNPYYLYGFKDKNVRDNNIGLKDDWPMARLSQKKTEQNKKKTERKLPKIERHRHSDEESKIKLVANEEYNNYPLLRKYNLEQLPGAKKHSAVDSSPDFKEANGGGDSEYVTTYNEYFQSPPIYDDYDGLFNTKLDSANGFPSLIDPLKSARENKKSNKNKSKSASKELNNDDKIKDNSYDYTLYDEDLQPKPKLTLVRSEYRDQDKIPTSMVPNVTQSTNSEESADINIKQTERTVKSFESITDFLKKARDMSLRTPEFAVPYALDSEKGYVELTHLVKYPKVIMYRPQFLVKNTMPYDSFLDVINNFNMTTDEVKLMKISRHLPDNTVKVLFETEDFESPLEVRNINSNRRSGIPVVEVNYPLQSRADMYNKKYGYGSNTDFINHDSFANYRPINRDGDYSSIIELLSKTEGFNSFEDNVPSASHLDLDLNTEINATMDNLSTASSESSINTGLNQFLTNVDSGLVPSLSPAEQTDEADPGLGLGSQVAIGSKVGSNIDVGTDTSQIGSYLHNILPAHTIPQSQPKALVTSNVNLPSDSLPTISARLPEFEDFLPTKTQSSVKRWWTKWKNIFKGKMKKIAGKMATLADNIDHIAKL